MVTEAGKELLRNSINTAKFHNKILEENDMWKQWELERGLTMMVSDDAILKRIRKEHQCAKHRKQQEKSGDGGKAGTSSSARWDHSGYQELYPDEGGTSLGKASQVKSEKKEPSRHRESSSTKEVTSKRQSSLIAPRSSAAKWDHSGFHELYPEEKNSSEKRVAASTSKTIADRWDHSGFKELYPDEDESSGRESPVSASKKKKKKKKRKPSKGSTSDNEIYEEFKRYKKSQKEKQKSDSKEQSTSGYDAHIKDWKNRCEKL